MPARLSRSSDADQASLIQTVGFLYRCELANYKLWLTWGLDLPTNPDRDQGAVVLSLGQFFEP